MTREGVERSLWLSASRQVAQGGTSSELLKLQSWLFSRAEKAKQEGLPVAARQAAAFGEQQLEGL